MATNCPAWNADGNFTGFSIRLDIPSHFVQHTVFALVATTTTLVLPPMKSSNLGIGEAKRINATSDLQASFNTAGLTGIVELSDSQSIHSTHQLALIV